MNKLSDREIISWLIDFTDHLYNFDELLHPSELEHNMRVSGRAVLAVLLAKEKKETELY